MEKRYVHLATVTPSPEAVEARGLA
ncbi:hypothetical protein [Streptoalloteichus tenebrarius]